MRKISGGLGGLLLAELVSARRTLVPNSAQTAKPIRENQKSCATLGFLTAVLMVVAEKKSSNEVAGDISLKIAVVSASVVCSSRVSSSRVPVPLWLACR